MWACHAVDSHYIAANIVRGLGLQAGAVRRAALFRSCYKLDELPECTLPEYPVIGRSNVGKSSLINLLGGSNDLAKTSAKPGKTRSLNFYRFGHDFYLVDCPGYGYARVAKSARLEWHELTKQYFLNRKCIAAVLLLVDASIHPPPLDLECAGWLAGNQIPFLLIFSKIDKSRSAPHHIQMFNMKLTETMGMPPPFYALSNVTGEGRNQVLKYLRKLSQQYQLLKS